MPSIASSLSPNLSLKRTVRKPSIRSRGGIVVTQSRIASEIAVPWGVPSTLTTLMFGACRWNDAQSAGLIPTPVSCGASWTMIGTGATSAIAR